MIGGIGGRAKENHGRISKMKRSKTRSLLKSITYRFICSAETFLVTYLVTGSLKIGGGVAGILFFTKLFTYFAHERIWEHVHWGKNGS